MPTLAQVDIANYPFCTIDPNVGVAFVEAFTLPLWRTARKNSYRKDGSTHPAKTTNGKGVCASHEPVRAYPIAALCPFPLSMWPGWSPAPVKVAGEATPFLLTWPTVTCSFRSLTPLVQPILKGSSTAQPQAPKQRLNR